ncbi:DUF4097 family beta strand repeat-containing protein [Natrarchaeobius oligotrophus]|uniref:DUF4097 domain-containing protein n=1 Tax=Natrarchaeobius chitinivorans TaxID=1679083 RepID=A0A3N6PJ98_NATCH|nr:DUF4097 family beta strand repeat-containing protein [Natrarchaeobius chitinivorans]RQG98545.1 hypothetical protein EA472_17215 [Natrarchaeobius chitinivorans]
MPQDLTRRRLLGGLSAAGVATLAGCTGSTPFVGRRIEDSKEFDPDGAETIAIVESTGDVSVAGDDRDTVAMDVVKQASSVRTDLEALELTRERVDDVLEFRSEYRSETGWFESEPAMNLDVAVPEELAVDRLRTSTGRITARNVRGDLAAESSTGTVRIESVDGTVAAETSTGSIEIRDVAAVGSAFASTGSIDAEIPAIDGDTDVRTSTGGVDAALSPDLDAELEVSTSTGSIDVGDLELDDAHRDGDFLRATLGDGGPRLRVETSTGSIALSTL